MKRDPVTQAMICEKARLIFEELQKKTPGSTSNKTGIQSKPRMVS
jgi:hypothetical protein